MLLSGEEGEKWFSWLQFLGFPPHPPPPPLSRMKAFCLYIFLSVYLLIDSPLCKKYKKRFCFVFVLPFLPLILNGFHLFHLLSLEIPLYLPHYLLRGCANPAAVWVRRRPRRSGRERRGSRKKRRIKVARHDLTRATINGSFRGNMREAMPRRLASWNTVTPVWPL